MGNADEYIYFSDCAVPDVRKTRIVNVVNRSEGIVLGQIRWHGAWRQYCFTPTREGYTIFNEDCLRRIAEECKTMTEEHRIGKTRDFLAGRG